MKKSAPKPSASPASPPATVASAKAATRNTSSGPSEAPPDGVGDALTQHAADVNSVVASVTHNANKAGEYGHDSALSPPEGVTVEAPSLTTTASTLSEFNTSAKTGAGAVPGVNATIDSLDRVRADGTDRVLTTNQGVPIADNQHSLKAGLRGPTLLEDFILREKITHFDHERIPERIVHARGSAAHGFFEAYESLSAYTRASVFAEAGKQTPVFVRFSTVAGERGSVDTARDVRGFAVKFYTDEGNWDLVGNNIPVFFIQDAMKFPDLVHAVKPEPHHGMPQAASAHDTFWDFVSLMPESTHMLLWVMSDRAIPRSYRMMQGFGVHTYRLVNDKGEAHFVKFHWKPREGTHSLVWDEAVKIAGADPDFHRRDLWEAIEAGAYPEWELGMQIFTEEQAASFSFDVLDATKIIPEELVPVRPVGRLVLNRNPDNFFAETEQVAFCVAHVVPGIDFSNDPLLGGRIHSYVDTQISRLGGPNFHEIPINAPVVQVHNNQRDGLHRQAIHRGRVAYEPNSLGGGCPFQAGARGFVSYAEKIGATAADAPSGKAAKAATSVVTPEDKVRGAPEKFAEHYAQATLFYNSQTKVERAHIIGAFRFELSKLTVPAIRARMLSSLRNVSEELAAAVADGLGMELPPAMPKALDEPPAPEVTVSPALSLMALPGEGSIRARKIAILVADGVEGDSIQALQEALVAQGAVPRLVGSRLGPVTATSGATFDADASMENTPAVLFDALVLPCGQTAVEALSMDGRTMEFIKDQYRHGKTILALGFSVQLLGKAGVSATLPSGEPDEALITVQPGQVASVIDAFIASVGRHRYTPRDSDPPLV